MGPTNSSSARWTHELTRYHWFVLAVAALGWLFDTMDQQLFTLARQPAMQELLSKEQNHKFYGGLATSVFLLGWATGGLTFGILGDRIGRARTMIWTILIYSVFTGLSAASFGFWDFALYRFLTGLGVGGEFAVGVALVAEVMPDKARPFALGLLQALSAVGNISAALISMALGQLEGSAILASFEVNDQPIKPWRIMFLVGTIPALLAILIRRRLKEPERWQKAVAEGGVPAPGGYSAGSYAELFGDPRWRKNAITGLFLASAGVIGLWGIGFFSVELLGVVLTPQFAAEGGSQADIDAKLSFWKAMALITQNIGGFIGIYVFTRVTHRLGRRRTFALFFVFAMLTTAMVFSLFSDRAGVFWMLPIMGFFQFALFGGYAIYFPELFPTRLRSTGTSFCYNVGRYVAAVGPFTFGLLSGSIYAGFDEPLPTRYAGVTMCAVFLIGLAALPFAPETKGQPLPE